ncbi:MAG: ImmA/IrrE family metallo-endopeptidase [Melioribacteraceae bacterium]
MSNRIKLLAEKILVKNNIKSLPISLKKIAKNEKITLASIHADDKTSGFLYKKNEKIIIGYNSEHHPNRQNFTIAHELGHYFLQHFGDFFIDKGTILFRDERTNNQNYKQEREANKFAAELLLPEDLLLSYIKREKIVFDDRKEINEMADDFGVSTQALTIRLTNLGLIAI